MDVNVKTKNILTYDDVVKFSAGNSKEELVDVRKYDASIVTEYLKEDMLEHTGDTIFVRDTLAKKLANVNKKLSNINFGLKIVYGYRHPDVQQKYFDRRSSEIKEQFPTYTHEQIKRYTHNFVAVPDVAGHPSGAAVDLTVIDALGHNIDMGTEIADYIDPIKITTYADTISKTQLNNRLLLHDLMIEQEFAPFYGEWWHFSYGDREWAAFYNKKAPFGAVKFSN